MRLQGVRAIQSRALIKNIFYEFRAQPPKSPFKYAIGGAPYGGNRISELQTDENAKFREINYEEKDYVIKLFVLTAFVCYMQKANCEKASLAYINEQRPRHNDTY
jgi:hypothetical protein